MLFHPILWLYGLAKKWFFKRLLDYLEEYNLIVIKAGKKIGDDIFEAFFGGFIDSIFFCLLNALLLNAFNKSLILGKVDGIEDVALQVYYT